MSQILSIGAALPSGVVISQYHGTGFPPGTVLDPSTGILSGTPIGDGSGTMKVTALPVSGNPIKMTIDYTVTNGSVNTVYRQGISGSISGFDTISFADDATLSETNNSIGVLTDKLRELIALYAPENLRSIEKTVLDHVRNFNNPHRDTIEDITGGDITEVFDLLVPGTVPLRPPVASYKAALEMGSPCTSLGVSRASDINIIDEQGYLRFYAENAVGTDWSTGYPVIPCWPAVTQLIDVIDPQTNTTDYTANNTTMVSAYNTGVVPSLLSTQFTLTETAVQDAFSLSYSKASLLTSGSDYTVSFFIYPDGYTSGTVYVDIGSDAHAFFSLGDMANPLVSTGAKVYVNTLPNGWYRVGISYTSSTTTGAFTVGYDPHTYTDLTSATASITNGNRSYIGTSGKSMFALFGFQIVDVPGLPPFIQSGSLAATTLTYDGFDNAASLTTGMLNYHFYLYETLKTSSETTLMSIPDVFTMTTDETNVLSSTIYIRTMPSGTVFEITGAEGTTYAVSGTLPAGLTLDTKTGTVSGSFAATDTSGVITLIATSKSGSKDTITIPYQVVGGTVWSGLAMTTTASDDAVNKFALSFNSDVVSYLSGNDARVNVSDFQGVTYSAVPAIKTINFGPFFGGVVSFDQYAIDDDKDALSFLIGQ